MELGNIFELMFPFCHVPSELPGEPETPVWGLMPRVPVTCHLSVPTNLFHFLWPFLLQPRWGILWESQGSDRSPISSPRFLSRMF